MASITGDVFNIIANMPTIPESRQRRETTEHSKRLLIAIPDRNCLTHLVKQSARKELDVTKRGSAVYSI